MKTTEDKALWRIIRWLKDDWADKHWDGKNINTPLTDDQWSWVDENIIKPCVAIACAERGHEPTMDQCMMPKHDYCIVCDKLMPGEAHKKAEA